MNLMAAERRLQAAQRDGDIDTLDALLHPRVVSAGPDGRVFTKEDDLDAYWSVSLRMVRLVEEPIDVRDDGTTGVTQIVAAMEVIHEGSEVSARLRYMRLWVREDDQWRVLAATFAPVS